MSILKNQKTNLKYIAIIAVFAVIAGGVILAYINGVNKEINSSKINLPKTVNSETADWKTYKNEEYGFEFKYPNNWNYGLNILMVSSSNMVFCPPELSDSDPDVKCKWKSVGGGKPDTLAPILLFVDKLNNFSGKTNKKGFYKDPTGTYLYRLILSNNSFQDIYNKMLSSFKIIKQENISDLPDKNLSLKNWKTYKNEEYGFEIKYPEGSKLENMDITGGWQVKINLPFYSNKNNLDSKSLIIRILMTQFNNGVKQLATCASNVDTSHIIINKIDFNKNDVSSQYGGMKYASIATEYCAIKNNRAFKLTSQLRYDRDSQLPNFNTDEELTIFNQMLSTFRFTE